MAQIAIISTETAKDGLQYIGDVVGVFPDDHQFSATELAKFNFLTVGGSVADVQARLSQLQPRIEMAYQWTSDEKHHWNEPDGEPMDQIQVFRLEGDSRWYRLDNGFKFPINIDTLSVEEKQLIESIDINHPAVDSFIRKLVKDITALSGNDVEIKDLRNSEP